MASRSAASAAAASTPLPDYDFPVGTSFETQPKITAAGKTTFMFKTRAQWQCAAFSHVVTGRDCICSKTHLVRYPCKCSALLSASSCFSVHEQYVPSTKTVDDTGAGNQAKKIAKLPKRTTAYNHFRAAFADRIQEWVGIKKAAGEEYEKFNAMEAASEAKYQEALKTVDDTGAAGSTPGARRSSHSVSIYALAINGDGLPKSGPQLAPLCTINTLTAVP